MATMTWRCHNDFPVTVTIIDCTAVQKKEDDADSIVRFYNCEVAWGESKWRVSRRYNMFDQLHQDLRMEFSTAHCLPPLPPKTQPLEQLSRFVMSDEDDYDEAAAQFLKDRQKGLQVFLNILLAIPNVAWCKRFANFLEPDSGEMAIASEGILRGIYGLQRSQFGLAVSVLQQHYMENPLWRHIFPDATERRAGLEHFMMCYVEAAYYHGYAYVVGTPEQELAGISLWLPPGTDVTLMKMVKFGFLKCAYDTGMDASMLWQKVYSAWGEHRETIMGETPHWYLWAVATHPDNKDDSVMGQLISVVTDMSDNNLPTCPCYVEATTGPEVEFFKNGHGFQVVEYHEAGEGTLAYHLLRRDTPSGGGGGTAAAAAAAVGGSIAAPPIEGAAPAPAAEAAPSYEGSWV